MDPQEKLPYSSETPSQSVPRLPQEAKAHALYHQENWLKQLWNEDLRDFTIHWAADLAKIILLMTGLGLFYGLIVLLRQASYPERFLHILEEAHFWGTFVSFIGLAVLFLGKGVLGIGRAKK